MKKIVGWALALALLPSVALAETKDVRYVPVSPTWIPRLYVHAGGSADIKLAAGDVLASAASIADLRWSITWVISANTSHVIVKPRAVMPDPQLLTIPGAQHDYNVVLSSGKRESDAYKLVFFVPAAPVTGWKKPPALKKSMAVESCAPPLYSGYHFYGDKRIKVQAVCDDTVRTYVILAPYNGGPPGPSVIPYRVDPGGHQDQILNPSFDSKLHEWVLDGLWDHLALVADSSRGQIRLNIDREDK